MVSHLTPPPSMTPSCSATPSPPPPHQTSSMTASTSPRHTLASPPAWVSVHCQLLDQNVTETVSLSRPKVFNSHACIFQKNVVHSCCHPATYLVPSPPKGRFPMLNFTQKLQSNKICLDVLKPGREHRSLGTFQPFSSIVLARLPPHNQLTRLITDLTLTTLSLQEDHSPPSRRCPCRR